MNDFPNYRKLILMNLSWRLSFFLFSSVNTDLTSLNLSSEIFSDPLNGSLPISSGLEGGEQSLRHTSMPWLGRQGAAQGPVHLQVHLAQRVKAQWCTVKICEDHSETVSETEWPVI